MDDKLKLEEVASKGYGVIYKMPMLDKDLDVVAKAFYAYLCSYAGAGDIAFPGMDKICNDLGVSRQRLERHRKALVDKGYITINQIKEKGKFARNEYRINKELSPLLQNATTEKPTTEKPTTENVTINNNNFNNNNSNNNNSNINNIPPTKSKAKYDESSPYYQMAQYMYQLIKSNNETIKEPNYQTWSDDFRKIVEIDKREKEQLGDVLRFSQDNTFWRTNILSPAKLRKQYSTLYGQLKNDNVKPYKEKIFNPWEEDDFGNTTTQTNLLNNSF